MSLDVTKMRKINFRMNELLKYETIKELVDHKQKTKLHKNSVYQEDRLTV